MSSLVYYIICVILLRKIVKKGPMATQTFISALIVRMDNFLYHSVLVVSVKWIFVEVESLVILEKCNVLHALQMNMQILLILNVFQTLNYVMMALMVIIFISALIALMAYLLIWLILHALVRVIVMLDLMQMLNWNSVYYAILSTLPKKTTLNASNLR